MRNHERALSPAAALLAVATVLTACGNARGPVERSDSIGASVCTGCHGGVDNATGAPPRALRATASDTTATPAIGAHTAHVTGGALARAFTCTDCHPDPRNGSKTHLDGTVDLVFGSLASAGGSLSPSYDRGAYGCSATYCHGGFPGGNTANTPVWNRVDGTQAACGTCHGVPPSTPHPQRTDCGSCHTGYTATTVNVATHVNGIVDLEGLTCASCHGDPARAPSSTEPLVAAAPPVGTHGETLPSQRAVGAHQRHVASGTLTAGVGCRECHLVPSSPEHSNGAVDMSFGPIATTAGASPNWNGTTCASTYCHGNFRNGNASYAPTWTSPAATACGTCHTIPPPAPHTQSTNCGGCHPGYTSTTVNVALHVNGTIDVGGLTCTSCHGDPARQATQKNPLAAAAPPVGTNGETQSSNRAVGAHQRHLFAALGAEVACSECHVVPTSTSHPNGQVELSFGALASQGGVTPSWNGTTCSNTYCHGNFKGGNAGYAPNWTSPNPVFCGSCHALPPPAPHPQNTNCVNCHPSPVGATHVNGVIDLVGITCTSCHGDSTRQPTALNPQLPAAPPLGTRGEKATTDRAVGAHQRHLTAGAIAAGISCSECHQVPTSLAHPTGTVELTWGTIATTGGASPQWNGTTCANTYCHGTFKNGNASYAPTWTSPAANACGTCHGLPPPGPHPQNTSCGNCHAGYTSSTANLSLHLNGTVDLFGMTCTSCHGDSTRQPTATNPQLPAAPPVGTRGETLTTDRAVGAHQRHLTAGAMTAGVSCTECHQVPTSLAHATGTVELTWGTIATTGGLAPQWNGTTCSNTYCHGDFKNGNAAYAPTWTSPATNACGTCHGLPPSGTHPQNTSCGNCHAGYTSSTVNLALHLNGTIDLVGLTCTSCHGDATRLVTTLNPQLPAAPPLGTRGETLPSQPAVGAHQRHLVDGPITSGVACTECHQVPTSLSHPTGTVELVWGTTATTGGAVPRWDGTALTCSNSYCHGNFRNGNTSYVPTWTAPASTVCGTCHSLPPPAPHPQNTSCGGCHTGYTSSSVNKALHVNGTIDVAGLTCTSCHGDATRVATALNPQLPAAPPVGTSGETLPSQRAVGAHQRHLTAGVLTGGISCAECHQVPTSTMHATGTVELAFGTLATTGSVTPAWNGVTCTNTYCHGNFRNGNASYAPTWTSPATTPCGTCHGLPPPGPHPQNPNCGGCHNGYTSSAVNTSLHVNGTVDVAGLTCTSCHGDSTRAATTLNPQLPAAPPIGTSGQTLVTDRAVGAHQRHLTPGAAGNGVACSECHQVPTSTTHPTGTVEISWGPLTTTGGVSPTWNGATCQNTYCHGNFRNGNAAYAPIWTSQVATACGTCHGLPPGGTHPISQSCGGCHGGYTRSSVNATNHMNGRVDLLPLACTSCHGDASRVGVAGSDLNIQVAPPPTATGRSEGAHLPHANNGSVTTPVGCGECHSGAFDFSKLLGPNDLNGHPSGNLVVAFAGRATGPGADTASVTWSRPGIPPTYDPSSLTCSTTYCHGNYTGTYSYQVYDYGTDSLVAKTVAFAGGQGAPVWTGGPMTCDMCHANPPQTGVWHSGFHGYDASYRQCQLCHPDATGTSTGGTGITNPALHVNGVVDVAPQWNSKCFGCH